MGAYRRTRCQRLAEATAEQFASELIVARAEARGRRRARANAVVAPATAGAKMAVSSWHVDPRTGTRTRWVAGLAPDADPVPVFKQLLLEELVHTGSVA